MASLSLARPRRWLVYLVASTRVAFDQEELLDLAGRRSRQRLVLKIEGLRRLEAGETLSAGRQNAFDGEGSARAGRSHDRGGDALAPELIGQTEHRAIGDAGDGDQRFFDLGGVDVLTARDDHVLQAALDEDEAVFVHHAEVAGVNPAATERLG